MTFHVLVPLEDADLATEALEYVLSTFPDADVTALHVVHPFEADVDPEVGFSGPWDGDWFETATEEAEALLDRARDLAAERGVTLSTAVEVGRPARAILDYVEEHDVDHVVVGSHGRSGVSRVLLGSVAETVVRRSPVPVTVVR